MRIRLLNRTHEFASGLKKLRVYQVWKRMRQRCYNSSNPSYARYGGRGISICGHWDKFENFFRDMGLPPTKYHSIDRINNNQGYTPENCRWSTKKEQANNRSKNRLVSFCGERLTVRQWEAKLGFKEGTLWYRINRGWPISRALSTPTMSRREAGKFLSKRRVFPRKVLKLRHEREVKSLILAPRLKIRSKGLTLNCLGR